MIDSLTSKVIQVPSEIKLCVQFLTHQISFQSSRPVQVLKVNIIVLQFNSNTANREGSQGAHSFLRKRENPGNEVDKIYENQSTWPQQA